jgi:MFS family permease
MGSHLAVLASLALAILFSPETLVLGLIMASDKKVPKAASYAFAIGAILGIAFATGVGLFIAHATGDDKAVHHGWPGFIVRMVIAGALLVIGIYRGVNALLNKPIVDVSKPEHKPGKVRTALTARFPKVMHRLDPNADLPVKDRVVRASLAGFTICGLHPKVFPIAIAAGHQLMAMSARGERTLGMLVFGLIAVIPALVPAVIETISPGASGRTKEGYERIMKEHGRWITAVLLIGVGLFIGHDAWKDIPTH